MEKPAAPHAQHNYPSSKTPPSQTAQAARPRDLEGELRTLEAKYKSLCEQEKKVAADKTATRALMNRTQAAIATAAEEAEQKRRTRLAYAIDPKKDIAPLIPKVPYKPLTAADIAPIT